VSYLLTNLDNGQVVHMLSLHWQNITVSQPKTCHCYHCSK